MQQALFSVIGLGMDIVGVLLLSLDWWLAHDQLKSELELAEALQKSKDVESAVLRMTEAKWASLVSTEAHRLIEARRHWYWIGLNFLFVGFALQVLGSWPGGIPLLGVEP